MEHFNWGLFWYLEFMTMITAFLFSYGPNDENNNLQSWMILIGGTIVSFLFVRLI